MCSIGAETFVKIWNITNVNWTSIRNYTGHSYQVLALEWINEYTLASGSFDFTIKIWSLSTGVTQTTINTGSSV